MSESILMRVRRSALQTVAEALRSWPREHLDNALDPDLQDLVRACQRWPDDLKEVVESLWRQARAGQVSDFQAAGEQVLQLMDTALEALDTLGRVAAEWQRQGRPVRGGQGAVLAVAEEVRRLRQQFVDNWLWINDNLVQEARAEYQRGEFQTVDEILNELQGKNP